MPFFTEKATLQAYLSTQKVEGHTIGFVPTMGALHQGHLSLIKRAAAENTICVVSIFVNPTQFNNSEDLEKYPRTLEADCSLIFSELPDSIVFAPSISEIYGTSATANHFDFDGLDEVMEGAHRKGHFDGVGTIVKALFDIVMPNNAYFGEKDFQQLCIIQKLVSKLQLPINVIPCAILREQNGLAMSSRNERLPLQTREKAAIIYESLLCIKKDFSSKNIDLLKETIVQIFEKEMLFDLEYFEIAEATTLQSATIKEKGTKYRAFIAVFANNVRLIDTISLN